MTRDIYPANAFVSCAANDCSGIVPGDQVHTDRSVPVQHAAGYCRPVERP